MDDVAVDTPAALAGWLARRERGELVEPLTFVVALDGGLRLAPRRSEHVTLAGGRDDLASGEMTFVPAASGWRVVDLDSWPAVGRGLDRVDVRHSYAFTGKVIFRRCPACGERNILRDNDFTCALCNSALPAQWNLTSN